ncbi:CS1-pili formation C-terminal domain-containing protein [Erwinia sp. P6884]|uniref:CS1-pili formation C-terminal domain-containing protein n=1 Tax=Erwinia sp. P6884 TaxID=3141450 RepID=UPI0031886239
MKKRIMISALSLLVMPLTPALAESTGQGSYILAGYRFPAALYAMLQSGLELPVLLDNNQQEKASLSAPDKYVQIGKATLFASQNRLGLRAVHMTEDGDNSVRLSDSMIKQLDSLGDKTFDDQMHLSVSPGAWFSLDAKQMRLILHVGEQGFGAVIRPREYDVDAPTSRTPSGTLTYDFGGYTTKSSQGMTRNSGYLNFNSTTSVGVDHLLLNGSAYSGNSLSSDRDGRINAALWERDYKGLRYAAGMLDSWNMQSVATVSALTGGEIYGFSFGNAANSRKRDGALSLTPVVVFFPAAGEARIRRDGNLIGIQRFSVGSHELDTSTLPFGIYSVQVEVVSGGRVISNGVYQINKPFSSNVTDGLRWQMWGGAYNRDRLYHYRYRADEYNKNVRVLDSDSEKEMMSLVGVSVGKSQGFVDWSFSSYMLREQAIGELWASSNITQWLSLNMQGMSATDGSWRGNYGGNLRLPKGIGNVWYSHSRLHSGEFLSLYETRGNTWGVSINLPSIGPASGGVISWTEDRDAIYGYKRRRLDYSQGLYAGRYGSVRLRTGIGYNDNTYGATHYSDRERYVMLDFSIPLGNAISVGVSHSRETGTAMNLDATHNFDGDTLKSVSANVSKSFSGDVEREVAGGATVDFDSPFNRNSLSYQTDNSSGWNATLTSQGSVGWSGTHIGAGKGRESAGLLIDTGLERGEKLTLDIDGTQHQLQGNRNFISLPPYANYRMEILNNADTLDSYDVVDGGRRTVSVYPGNVIYMQPQVKKIVTVFGRLVGQNGQAIANREIKNRFGLAQSGADGRFVIDIDRNHPQLNIATGDDSVCALTLNITSTDGALWLGDVQCDQGSYVWQQSAVKGEELNEKAGS